MDGKEQSKRQIQVALELRNIAQDFFQRESSGMSLITVTNTEISPDLRHTTIYITVLPETKEQAALDFAKRMRTDLRTRIKEKLQIKTIPFVEVEIDHGEKHRQNIEKLLREDRIRVKRFEEAKGTKGENEAKISEETEEESN